MSSSISSSKNSIGGGGEGGTGDSSVSVSVGKPWQQSQSQSQLQQQNQNQKQMKQSGLSVIVKDSSSKKIITNTNTNNKQRIDTKKNTTTATTDKVSDNYSTILLSYPHDVHQQYNSGASTSTNNVQDIIKPFSNNNSSYNDICTSCFLLNQYISSGGTTIANSTSTSTSASNLSTIIKHDLSYVELIECIYNSISVCCLYHMDRRCRIVCIQTLSIIGRVAYTTIRQSPIVFTQREPNTSSHIEDIIATDIPLLLVSIALNTNTPSTVNDDYNNSTTTNNNNLDTDDGIAAAAIEGLSILLLSNTTTIGNTLNDYDTVLLREIQSISYSTTTIYSPTIRSICDEDYNCIQSELYCRCIEDTILPRLVQLLLRCSNFTNSNHTVQCIPILSSALLYTIQCNNCILQNIDRNHYAKNYIEYDTIGLIDYFISSILIPLLTSQSSKEFNTCIAIHALQIANVCTNRSWLVPISQVVSTNIQDTILHMNNLGNNNATTTCIETKLTLLTILVISTRSMLLQDRYEYLLWIVNELYTSIPSTTTIITSSTSRTPLIKSPALRIVLPITNIIQLRRPARIGLYCEIALSFFIDSLPTPTTMLEQGTTATTTTNTGTTGISRVDLLYKFLNNPLIVQIVTEIEIVTTKSSSSSTIVSNKEELIYSFITVAIQYGRKQYQYYCQNQNHNQRNKNQPEWLQLFWIILTSFSSCVHANPTTVSSSYMEEELSLTTAYLTAYVQLLQEYMYYVGLLNPLSSITIRLCSNACPPHIVWDQLVQSSDYLVSNYQQYYFNPHQNQNQYQQRDIIATTVLKSTTKLFEELIGREIRQGIPSHHMRLYIVSLATDHWIQGRICSVRINNYQYQQQLQQQLQQQQQKKVSGQQQQQTPPPPPPPKMDISLLDPITVREILLSLAPKRLLSKILKSHNTPIAIDSTSNDGKQQQQQKRDPIKKLLMECCKVSVACIESIALVSCEWRRRNGSSQESKNIINIAVGILQLKIDDNTITLQDDTIIKSIIVPIADAAKTRIQLFYEEKSTAATNTNTSTTTVSSTPTTDSGFPQSELTLQPVKVKIKPLVSSTANTLTKPSCVVMKDYMMQLCRQIVAGRCLYAMQSWSGSSALQKQQQQQQQHIQYHTNTHPQNNWFRLTLLPISDTKDGRIYGHRGNALSTWDSTVIAVSAPSDPVQVVLGYTIRRKLRYDTEEQYCLVALMRVYNMTAIDFEHGIQLELGMIHNNIDSTEVYDPISVALCNSIGVQIDDIIAVQPTFSSSAVYKECIKSSDYITWEVELDNTSSTCCTALSPTVIFRNVAMESDNLGSTIVGGDDDMHSEAGRTTTVGDRSTTETVVSGGEEEEESDNGEQDFQITTSDTDRNDNNNNNNGSFTNLTIDVVDDVRIPLQTLTITPMIRLQPCPLVFFTDKCGDVDSFRVVWFRMVHHLAHVKVIQQSKTNSTSRHLELYRPNETATKIAIMSQLTWQGEAIPGGTATKLWAFMSMTGCRLYCVLSEIDGTSGGITSSSGKSTNIPPQYSLHFRSDDKSLLYCIAGSRESREAVVEALLPGMTSQIIP